MLVNPCPGGRCAVSNPFPSSARTMSIVPSRCAKSSETLAHSECFTALFIASLNMSVRCLRQSIERENRSRPVSIPFTRKLIPELKEEFIPKILQPDRDVVESILVGIEGPEKISHSHR